MFPLRGLENEVMPVTIRIAEPSDISAMASMRALQWGTEQYWHNRITLYLAGELSPQQALAARTAFVAVDGGEIVGFIAGHLTRRFQCDGELEWIDTIEQRRRQGIAGFMLRTIAHWFEQQGAFKVCVDPGNAIARAFYTRYGSQPLNQHWMVWHNIREIAALNAPI
jgi:GNAT superfamily N-acetyltransferase